MVFFDKCVGDRNLGDTTVENYMYRDEREQPPVEEYVGPAYFHGFRIIEAVLRAVDAREESNPMDLVVFQTHSNGSNGQYLYIDRAADIVRDINADAEVRGITTGMVRSGLDLEASADDDGLTHWDHVYDNIGAFGDLSFHLRADADSDADGVWISPWVYRDGGLEYERNEGWGTIDDTPVVDASCLAAHSEDITPCLDQMHVLLNHISTPIFVVAQQRDDVDNGSQHSYTTRFDLEKDCDPDDDCCHDENYPDEFDCTFSPERPFLATSFATFTLDDFGARVLSTVRALRERFETHSEMRPDCTGSPCDTSTLPSPPHGAFIDDIFEHNSLHDTNKSTSVIEGRQLESYLYDWLVDDVDTFCVDISGDGVNDSGTAADWALCPEE
jgi:hypothetical protein